MASRRPSAAMLGPALSKHYDVVVLGAGLGALTAAALLARRTFRVLVLGQGHRPAAYGFEGNTLLRRPFTLLAHASPAWTRVLTELAQTQTFRRRTLPVDPMLQVLGPGFRLDLPPDAARFGRELDREFPDVRRPLDDVYADLARTNGATDAVFEKDAVFPPSGFWERREALRLTRDVPHLEGDAPAFVTKLPREHPVRAAVMVPADFASHAMEAPAFALARLHGAWARGAVRLEGGEDELTEFMLDRVRAHGGEVRLGDRAASLVHRAGKVTGVAIDGDETPVGVHSVVTDLPARVLLELATGFTSERREMTEWPRLILGEQRFVVSLLVRREGVPAPLAHEAFVLPGGAAIDPVRPRVHVQRVDGASPGPSGSAETLLVAEALFPASHALPANARESVLRSLEAFLPFLERHYLVVDSPHDGRPLWDYRSGTRREVERARLRATGGVAEPEPMTARWHVDPPWFYRLAGEPIRTPLGGTFLAGRTPLPALGQEGELLAAWSAARIITKRDRRKEAMRREMWTKVELG